jgi:hypothetical protein
MVGMVAFFAIFVFAALWLGLFGLGLVVARTIRQVEADEADGLGDHGL